MLELKVCYFVAGERHLPASGGPRPRLPRGGPGGEGGDKEAEGDRVGAGVRVLAPAHAHVHSEDEDGELAQGSKVDSGQARRGPKVSTTVSIE